jgi:hypothetical protein
VIEVINWLPGIVNKYRRVHVLFRRRIINRFFYTPGRMLTRLGVLILAGTDAGEAL